MTDDPFGEIQEGRFILGENVLAFIPRLRLSAYYETPMYKKHFRFFKKTQNLDFKYLML